MRGIALGLVLASGCSLYFGESQAEKANQPSVEPRTCGERISFAPVTSDARNEQFSVDHNGRNVCMHLDTTQIGIAELWVSSTVVLGTSSGIAATLADPGFRPIADGDDVVATGDQPTTEMQLQWPAPALTQTDVVLWVRSQGDPANADLLIELFDPDI